MFGFFSFIFMDHDWFNSTSSVRTPERSEIGLLSLKVRKSQSERVGKVEFDLLLDFFAKIVPEKQTTMPLFSQSACTLVQGQYFSNPASMS